MSEEEIDWKSIEIELRNKYNEYRKYKKMSLCKKIDVKKVWKPGKIMEFEEYYITIEYTHYSDWRVTWGELFTYEDYPEHDKKGQDDYNSISSAISEAKCIYNKLKEE